MPSVAMRLAIISLLTLVVGACGSTSKPTQDEWVQGYDHGPDFLFEESKAVLEKRYEILVADREKLRLETAWDTELAYFSEQGERSRLTIELEERPQVGWVIKLEEEKELNSNQVNPASAEDAEWKSTESDGAMNAYYRLGMTTRMRPRNKWRRDRAEELDQSSRAEELDQSSRAKKLGQPSRPAKLE